LGLVLKFFFAAKIQKNEYRVAPYTFLIPPGAERHRGFSQAIGLRAISENKKNNHHQGL
jgi:hypothetical protein